MGSRCFNCAEIGGQCTCPDPLLEAIRQHRDEHHRLDTVEMDQIAKELARGDADIALWSVLPD